ncbi:DNA polymerase II [Stygiolobus caldivivus]|uniref:DNA-directed DNA polymerase n=1 Tax=Stygiolobus caldivivus TaxID=2824673 RepID=A0A8D5U8B6_9CREN|nr:DNA polymerase II [Stygiolobus caldivivus]
MTTGYLIDARPLRSKVRLTFEKGVTTEVKTTFPVYLITDTPYSLLEHPAVEKVEEEEWYFPPDYKNKGKVYRVELNDLSYYEDVVKRAERKLRALRVNTYPSILTQTLLRLKAYPMHLISVDNGKVALAEQEGSLSMPELKIATVETYSWYGLSEKGEKYKLYINGEEVDSGYVKEFEFDEFVDIAECMGDTCNGFKKVTVKVDLSRAFLRARGLMEWSKLSKTLLREIRYGKIGKVVTTNVAIKALKRKYLVPHIKVNVEKPKTLDQLAKADKGGLILIPKPGCYNNVYQMDFSSFYPSIIIKYNISPETIDECDDIKTEIGHSICLKRKGVVPEALEEIVKRKEMLKDVDEERAEAVKWVLVASFGYLGYRHSRFGRIEAYELVTYFSRRNMREAMKIVQESGGKVLHAIVDSVFYQGNVDVSRKVEESLGFKVKAEKYSWVLLTQSRGYGVPTRYVARYPDSKVKVKGLIRENLPNVVKKFLRNAVDILSEAETCEEAREKVVEIELMKEGVMREIEPKDLVVRIKDKALLRGGNGFYDADLGYSGSDLEYYREYLNRWEEILLTPLLIGG